MNGAWRIYRLPVLFALTTSFGLFIALADGGDLRWAAWLGVGMPAATSLRFGLRRSSASGRVEARGRSPRR